MTDASKTVFLVATDNDALRQEATHFLKELGYTRVLAADTGTRAFMKIKNQRVDFILCSNSLGEMDGTTLLKLVRADPETLGIPFVMLLRKVTKEVVIKTGAAGVTDIVRLPLEYAVFQQKLERLIVDERDPQVTESERHLRQGVEAVREGKLQVAIQAFQRALKINESPEVYYNLGYVRTAQGRFSEAITCFRKATELNNAFAKAYHKMGDCYQRLGEAETAQDCFERAAEIYMDRNMDAEAEKVLKQALELAPETINIYNSLGILYRRQGMYKKALDLYQKALKVAPRDEHIHFNVARLHYEAQAFDKCQHHLTLALGINPNFKDAKNLQTILDRRC